MKSKIKGNFNTVPVLGSPNGLAHPFLLSACSIIELVNNCKFNIQQYIIYKATIYN